MKRAATALTLIMALLFSAVAGTYFVKTAHASIITVPDDYSSIQDAINAANEGDTIFVKSGKYQEQQLIINKTLSLIGENPDNTKIILSPPVGPYGGLGTVGIDYPIKIEADNVTLSGFTITANGERPILLGNGGNVIAAGSGTRIIGNIFETGVSAIGDQTYITNNTINDMSRSTYASLSVYGASQVITKNTVSGIWVENSVYDIIAQNNVVGATGGGAPTHGVGIELRSATRNQIVANNIVSGGPCVQIDFFVGTSGLQTRQSDNNTLYQNNFVNNSTHIDQVGYGGGSYSVNNIWYNNAEGNYWSDYTSKYPKATEIDHSGVGDTPYVIDVNNVDQYPLVAPVNISNVFVPLPQWASFTINFTIDVIAPTISVLSPENRTYNTSSVPLNFTVNEASQITYSLDGEENVTTLGNTTLTGLANGDHKLTVYAWDEAGNVGVSETISFTVAKPPEPEPFPTTLVITASGASVAAIGLGLLVYFKKRKRVDTKQVK